MANGKDSYAERGHSSSNERKPLAEVKKLVIEDDRTGMSDEAFERAFLDNLFYMQGISLQLATSLDHFCALAYTVRDRLMHRWLASIDAIVREKAKVVCYLSAEFLMGKQLANNLLNIGCFRQVRHALARHNIDLNDILEAEPEPGLGNGGLGRLAACFLDSLATQSIPAVGYGIRYEFGIFRQQISDGWQIEQADDWLRFGNPWEIVRPERTALAGFGGTVEWEKADGAGRRIWRPSQFVQGTPHDTLVPGFATNMVNTLRLWRAHATRDFDFDVFNTGDYTRAVADKTLSENISKVLYPNDLTASGKELRLKQQYFFVACSLHNMLWVLSAFGRPLEDLPDYVAAQLNDTHPSIAIAELMRLLVDAHGLPWETAWDITNRTFGYTNHTLMDEALERWPLPLFQQLLPRHLEIIFEINRRFLDSVAARFPGDIGKLARMSLIEEGTEKRVRMANLAVVGSHAVNGVAELHTKLVRTELFPDFDEMYPERFSNKTNGVTPRRWLMLSNQKVAYLLTETLGKGWICDLSKLRGLERHADDAGFREHWQMFNQESKADLAAYVKRSLGLTLNPSALFDVHVKRIHEYKRQLLNVLHIIALYRDLADDVNADRPPRVCIFSGKAAPGYHQAKLIIKLINSVAEVINNDPKVKDRLKVVFLPNFSVTLGEQIYPAADLSQQISTAGTEASGTGNMKFALNGAVTIGTLDGANIELRDAVGADNFFLFGHTVDQLREKKAQGYSPWQLYQNNKRLHEVIDSLTDGTFARGDQQLYQPLVDELKGSDRYFLFADFQSYLDAQRRVEGVFTQPALWNRMSILNTARVGFFSSDRTVLEYAEEIWNTVPVNVELPEEEAHAAPHSRPDGAPRADVAAPI